MPELVRGVDFMVSGVGVLDLDPVINSRYVGVADEVMESSPPAGGDSIDVQPTEGVVPSLPAVFRNDKEPLLGVVVEDDTLGAITRFIGANGPVETLLKPGPLPEENFTVASLLRQLILDGKGPLECRSVAQGNQMTLRATNERTAEAFRLLAQGALGRTYELAGE